MPQHSLEVDHSSDRIAHELNSMMFSCVGLPLKDRFGLSFLNHSCLVQNKVRIIDLTETNCLPLASD